MGKVCTRPLADAGIEHRTVQQNSPPFAPNSLRPLDDSLVIIQTTDDDGANPASASTPGQGGRADDPQSKRTTSVDFELYDQDRPGRALSTVHPEIIDQLKRFDFSTLGEPKPAAAEAPGPTIPPPQLGDSADQSAGFFRSLRLQSSIGQKSLAKILELAQTDPREARPPHALVSEKYPEEGIGRFEFYVSLYSLRLKHVGPTVGFGGGKNSRQNILKRRSFSSVAPNPWDSSSTHFVIVIAWNNNEVLRRTDVAPADGVNTVLFKAAWSFYWVVPAESLKDLTNRFLTLAIYKVENMKTVQYYGSIQINLLTIATGPIHHDFAVKLAPGYSFGSHRSPRLQLDCRMSQICWLKITPIEISAEIEAASEGGERSGPLTPMGSQLSVEGASYNVASGSFHSTNTPPPSTTTATVTIKNSFRSDASDLDIMRSKSVTNLESKAIVGREPVSVANVETTPVPIASTTDEDDGQIAKAAAGGHAAEDDKCPIVGEWRLEFNPTGVRNSKSFESTWTALTATPHWSLIEECTKTGYTVDAITGGADSAVAGPRNMEGPGDNLFERGNSVAAATKGHLSNLRLAPICDPRSSSKGPFESPWGPSQNNFTALHLMGDLFETEKLPPQSPRSSIPSNETAPSQLIASACGSATLPSSVAAGPPAAVQQMYMQVAEQCRSGTLLGDVLKRLNISPVLPTCHMVTTGDAVRQYYLHLKLWNKPLGVGPPKLFGEAWVPFFKLFDNEFVDSTCRLFYDVQFSETLWLEGRSVGKLKGIFAFQDTPLIRQMMAGIDTENGFVRIVTPAIEASGLAGSPVPIEVKQLHQALDDLQQAIMATTALATQKLTDSADMLADAAGKTPPTINLQITSEKVAELLRTSSVEDPLAAPTFQYESLPALLAGQRILIDLANHAIDSIEHVPWHVRGLYWSFCSMVLRRGELSIGSLLPTIPGSFRAYPEVLPQKLVKHAIKLDKARQKRTALEQPSEIPGDFSSPGPARSAFNRIRGHRRSRGQNSGAALSTFGGAGDPDSTIELENREHGLEYDPEDNGDVGGEGASLGEGDSFSGLSDIRLSPHQCQELIMFDRRMKIGRAYLLFLMKLCRLSLTKIQSEALFEAQRKHICGFLAALYIRLPELRRRILARILTEEEKNIYISGWRDVSGGGTGPTGDLDYKWSVKADANVLKFILDWQPFHDALCMYFGPAVAQDTLLDEACQTEALAVASTTTSSTTASGRNRGTEGPDPMGWLNPRGISFFLFLISWIRSISGTLDLNSQRRLASAVAAPPEPSGRVGGRLFPAQGSMIRNTAAASLRWDLIPGYTTLLKAFLVELRTRNVSKFPDAMLNCSAALLTNHRLLTVFMRIVLSRTSVYSREQVFSAYNYLDFWMEVLAVRNYPPPLIMDHRFMGRTLEATLLSDLALQSSKTIWFLYKRIDQLISQRSLWKILIDLLLHKSFNHLLLNWSWLVRKCFVSLLLYRICEQVRRIVARTGDRRKFDDEPGISIEDRLSCWAYVLLARNLERLGIEKVFPDRFTNYSVKRLLGSPPTDAYRGSYLPPLIWNIPVQLPEIAREKPPEETGESASTRDTNRPISLSLTSTNTPHGSEAAATTAKPQGVNVGMRELLAADTQDSTATLAKAGNDFKSPETRYRRIYARSGLRKLRRRRSVKHMAGANGSGGSSIAEYEVLQDPTGEDAAVDAVDYEDPFPFLPTWIEYTEQQRPYLLRVRHDFSAELEAYKGWVISGQADVPPMHIPASPLDTNVDVPLEDD